MLNRHANVDSCEYNNTAALIHARTRKVTIPAGTLLYVQIDKRYLNKVGIKVQGRLTTAIYLVDHEVLPINSIIIGSIGALRPMDRKTRMKIMLDGNFTPMVFPELHFDQIVLPDGNVESISTRVTQHDVLVVRMRSGKDCCFGHKERRKEKQFENDAAGRKNKQKTFDRFLRALYTGLPYQPQRLWPGTQFSVELTAPLIFSAHHAASAPSIHSMNGLSTVGLMKARLTEALSSGSTKQGQVVKAVLTKPYFDLAKKQVLLPEGTHLEGVILQAKPARWFARNGELCFGFPHVDLPMMSHGQSTISESSHKETIQMNACSSMYGIGSKYKYAIPLFFGLIAAFTSFAYNNSLTKNSVLFNGLALITHSHAVETVNRYIALGFSYYALIRSIYRYWLGKGKELIFPENTPIEIDLSEK